MTKSVLAINDSSDIDLVLGLFQRLRLQNTAPVIVHVVEPFPPAALIAPPGAVFGLAEELEDVRKAMEAHGKAVLEAAKVRLASAGISAGTALVEGHPVDAMLRFCAEEEVDLIVMGSEKKGPVAAALFGSMSRAMVQHAKRSLAIAKQVLPPDQPVHAVLATDHSPYMDRCLDELIRLAPRGIHRLDIVTAFTAAGYLSDHPIGSMPVMKENVLNKIVADLEERNEACKKRLHAVAPVVHSHVISDHPIPAIRKTMQETGADLLILGAHGHSAIQRLLLGSVSHHMVAVEPFSVWILRPKDEE